MQNLQNISNISGVGSSLLSSNGSVQPIYNFDGTDDYVDTGVTTTSVDFKITGRFKTTGGTQFIVDMRSAGSVGYIVWVNAGKLVFGLNTTSATTVSNYNDGVWHYFEGTYDGSNVNISIEGESVDAGLSVGSTSGNSARIGARSFSGPSSYFSGGLYDIKMYDTGSLIAWYDGSYGFYDFSGNGNDGTPVNITPSTFYTYK